MQRTDEDITVATIAVSAAPGALGAWIGSVAWAAAVCGAIAVLVVAASKAVIDLEKRRG